MAKGITPAAIAVPIVASGEGEPVRLLWARRTDDAPALPGFHVCPGGLIDPADKNARHDGGEHHHARVCALREMFEEVGFLVAHGSEALDADQREALRDAFRSDIEEGMRSFEGHELRWKTAALEPVGRWLTPEHAPRRFDTWFFAVRLDDACRPDPDLFELDGAQWVSPSEAIERWRRAEVLITPPMTALIHSLHEHDGLNAPQLRSVFGAKREQRYRWDVVPHIQMMALRTPTLPPATHTNSYLVGSGQAILVEPGTPHEEEIQRAVRWVEENRERAIEPIAIFATHHHPDHVGGALELSRRLCLPLWAHEMTAQRLAGVMTFDRLIEADEEIVLTGPTPVHLTAIHTPGHAPGHLCLLDRASRALICGDMVASVGTILVEPTDGDMALYLESLRAMIALEPSVLLPAHGMPVRAARKLLEHYIAHRLAREEKVDRALRSFGRQASAFDLVPIAYDDAPKTVWPIAAQATEAHLIKLEQDGRARRGEGGWSAI